MYKSVINISKSGLCTGCGICVALCPVKAISMKWDSYLDYVSDVDKNICINCSLCLDICPGKELDFPKINQSCNIQKEDKFRQGAGFNFSSDILYTKNKDSFNKSTSGGVVREILASLIENNEIDEVLQITDNKTPLEYPFFAPSKFINSPTEIRMHKIHSRYCPAPLLESLDKIAKENKRFAIVGLPCQVHAIRKLQIKNSKYKDRIKIIIGLLCSGTPTANANKYLFKENKIDIKKLISLDYRYGKWPKGVVGFDKDNKQYLVRMMGGEKNQSKLFQMIGMTFMSPYFWRRRCQFCPDLFNLYADIACGDPWVPSYWKGTKKHNIKGGTLTIVRTQKMQTFIENLIEKNILAIRAKVKDSEITQSMGKFQRKRISYFAGFKKIVHKFKMEFPNYKNVDFEKQPTKKNSAYIRLLKADLAKNEKKWIFLKYFTLVEEIYNFILRKLKII